MKNFSAKIVVRMKPSVKDVKGLTLKRAIDSYIHVEDLSCNVGSVYYLTYGAKDEAEALHFAEKIAQDILSNEVIETYEIKSLEEV